MLNTGSKNSYVGNIWIGIETYEIMNRCTSLFGMSRTDVIELALLSLDRELTNNKNSVLYRIYMKD